MAAPIKVVTGKAIIAHLNLFQPRAESAEINAGKYTAMVIVKKSDKETVTRIKEAIQLAIKSQWPDKVPAGVNNPLKDGDAKYEENEAKNAHLKGCYFLNANTASRPKVFDHNLQELIDPADVASGDYAKVSLNLKAYDKAGNKGVGCYLNAVQWLGQGPVVIGSGDARSDFDAEELDEVF